MMRYDKSRIVDLVNVFQRNTVLSEESQIRRLSYESC